MCVRLGSLDTREAIRITGVEIESLAPLERGFRKRLGGFELGRDGGEGPVEPGRQGLDIRGVDGGAAPDAQAGRGVAVAADVEGGALFLELGRQLLGEVGL